MGISFDGSRFGVYCCALWVLGNTALGQSVTNRQTLAPGIETKDALAGFNLEEGFRLELAAAEPMVISPVAIAFDENNRLYVAELSENPAKPAQGRVRLLEEPDDKGRFTTSAVFCEDLTLPSALACYGGGVFVATGKEIIFLKDSDADGIADVRKVILSGFGGTNALTSEALINNFNWALDNRIHAATAGIGGGILPPDASGQPVFLNGADFSFDPRTLAVVLENGPTGFGKCFDNNGREFVSEAGHPLEQSLAERRYWARNPFFVRAPQFRDVMDPATSLFSTRTGAVVSVTQTSIATTNGIAPQWLKRPRGPTIYRGNIFPTNYWGNAFICDPDAHVVHRVALRETGLQVIGSRPQREKNQEFLFSKEPSFNPVQVINGPEGALYIVDSRDVDHGRIYRVVPEHFQRPKPVQLGKAKTVDLVAALSLPDGWRRDTASRLLVEKRDPAALPVLTNIVALSQLPLAKIHALHVLSGTGTLKDAQVLKALQDKDAQVRMHALLVSETLSANGAVTDAVWNQMKAMAADSSILVRHQLALTAGTQRRADKPVLLAQLMMRDGVDPWMESAVLSSLGEGAGNVFLILAGDRRFRSDPAGFRFLQRLVSMIGVKGRSDEVGQLIGFLSREKLDAIQAFPLIYSFGDGLHRTRSALALVDPQGLLAGWYSTALAIAIDITTPEQLRMEAMKVVAVSPYTYAETGDWLLLVANPQPLPALRAAAVSTLVRYDDPRLVPALLERWSGFPSPLRRQAVEGLLSRDSRVPMVMGAIERGAIPIQDLQSPTLDFLRTYKDSTVSEHALKAFGPMPTARPEVLKQYTPALRLTGVAARGRELFIFRCAECHGMRESGLRVSGPDLAGIRTRGRVELLKAILEPNAEVREPFRTWILETSEGEVVTGVKADETPSSVTFLRRRGEAAVWGRASARALYERPWSLMPQGLEQGLSAQNMADLLEYLVNPL